MTRTSEAKVVFHPADAPQRTRLAPPDALRAWRWVGWLSLLLTGAALVDWILAWTPLRFGSPEWEFGTIVASYSGLPLLALGFAGILASALARGVRWQIVTASVVMLLFAFALLGGLVIFALDIPIALRAVQGPAHLGILKAIAKTGAIGMLFTIGFAAASLAALRHATARR